MKKSGKAVRDSIISNRENFKEYLLKEFENIAQAHFRTNESISSFFRYYLIIMALPISLYSAIISLSPNVGPLIVPLSTLSASVAIIIAIIGFFVLIYIINLRMDSLLYARNVNSIRKYFYDNSPDDLTTKLRTRVLPQTSSIPRYFDYSYFLPVVITFAIFNTVYMFLGAFLCYIPITQILRVGTTGGIINLVWMQPMSWIIPMVFLGSHIIVYCVLASHREHSYLKSYILGVDIDGVLNEHEVQFCELLHHFVGKVLTPKQITKIPVHEDHKLSITRSDEKKVFNEPSYWIEMPHKMNSAYIIGKLRTGFNLKIHIFSHRPWPSEERNSEVFGRWINRANEVYWNSQSSTPKVIRKLKGFGFYYKIIDKLLRKIWVFRMKIDLPKLGLEPINLITKCWLLSKKFGYDWLTIEKGSEDVSDPQGKFHNRFYISRKKKIRFFVEDVDEKAIKLAYICDVVFLLKRRYNEKKKLPNNVIPVSTWEEIYRSIRALS